MSSQRPGFAFVPGNSERPVGSHGARRIARASRSVLPSIQNSSTQSRQSLQHPPGLLSPSVFKQEQERDASDFTGNRHERSSDMSLARALAMEQILSASTSTPSLKAPSAFTLGGHVRGGGGLTNGQVPARSNPVRLPKPVVTSNGPLSSLFGNPLPFSFSFAVQQTSNPVPEFSGLSLSATDNKRKQVTARQTTPVSPSVPLLTTNKQTVNPVPSSSPVQLQPMKPEIEVLLTRTATVSPSPQLSSASRQSSSPSLPGDGDNDFLIGQNAVSLLNEETAVRGLGWAFEELGHSGPPHLREFTMEVQVGDIVTEGRGGCKKTAREAAARKALAELRLLKPLRSRRVSDETKAPLTSNAVGCLQEYVAKQHRPLPEYKMESASGMPHALTFVISVTVLGQTFTGQGCSKKEAKFNAARTALAAITGKNEASRQTGAVVDNVQDTRPIAKTRRQVINLDEDSQSRHENKSETQAPLRNGTPIPLFKTPPESPSQQCPDDAIRDMLQKAYQTGQVRPVNGCQALKHEETLKALANFLGYKLTSSAFQVFNV